jgi:hypothetical protein
MGKEEVYETFEKGRLKYYVIEEDADDYDEE